MRKMVLVLLVVLLTGVGFAEKVATLHEVMKPGTILGVDDTQFYVTENATIFIYSLKDYKLIKKFGKQGEGPREFMVHPRVPITIDVSTDDIIVNSLGKVSYFTKDGTYKREIKAPPGSFGFQPMGDQFLALGQSFADEKLYNTVNVYDSQLKKVKEIYRADSGLKGPGKGIKVLEKTLILQTYDNKIFLPGEKDGAIDVFDTGMKKLYTITVDIERQKVTQDFKDNIIHDFKTSPGTKDIYDAYLKPVQFPDYLPVFQACICVDKKVYVMTWKRENEKNEFYLYDMNGKFLKKKEIPIKYQSPLRVYPIAVRNDKLYQLVENIDEEEWDLYVEEIK
jgi:hypothetical protein